MTEQLPYKILDADNHFLEPPDLYERFIDPKKKDLAIRYVKDPSTGRSLQLFAGKPSKFTVTQVTYSKEELDKMLGQGGIRGEAEQEMTVMPGMLLNRLNPFKGLSEQERKDLVSQFRNQRESYGNRDLRLALMDEQGIEAALMYPASAHDIEFEFADDVDAMYANIRAFNRWIHEEIGYAADNRMFLPPYIALADVDLAVQELEILLETGAPMVQIKSGHAHGGRANPFGGRSVADPVFDPVWARVNEAGIRLCVHLGGTDYQKYGADWSEDPDLTFGDFDAFQWMMYWGDRPAMELTAGLILHNFFGRFPNIKVCLSEMGTVWLPYTLRKMDHAFLMGRKAKWAENGRLDRRPSQIFREHFVVAPYPEENVRRVVDEVGIDPIVFGSDFPHGEGLAYPSEYV
ncbi:MAG TPA: amidohydrolase family protein, partial [Acidimicrobiales bacterium]|nr:amidohydrolase family protein [Acidimicrobiales bacterium]